MVVSEPLSPEPLQLIVNKRRRFAASDGFPRVEDLTRARFVCPTSGVERAAFDQLFFL